MTKTVKKLQYEEKAEKLRKVPYIALAHKDSPNKTSFRTKQPEHQVPDTKTNLARRIR